MGMECLSMVGRHAAQISVYIYASLACIISIILSIIVIHVTYRQHSWKGKVHIHIFICSYIHTFIYSYIHIFIYLYIYLFIHSSVHTIITPYNIIFKLCMLHRYSAETALMAGEGAYSSVHTFIYSYIHIFIYSYIYIFIYASPLCGRDSTRGRGMCHFV
jgi:hypothetical protein